MNRPFSRAIAMMALVSAAMASAAPQAALANIGPYVSRGKGGKRPHRTGNGSAHIKRMATKARNVQRHRRACK
jgi:hypothetical protein